MRVCVLLLALLAGKSESEWLREFRRLRDHDVRTQLMLDLAREGEEAVPLARALLEEKDAEFRQGGLHMLAAIGPLAVEAVPDLRAMVRDKATTEKERVFAIHALGAIGPDAAPALPEVCANLDREPYRYVATWALAQIDPASEEMRPAVRRGLAYKGGRLFQILWIIERLGPSALSEASVIADLAETHENASVRRQALRCLWAIDARDRETERVVRAALDELDPRCRAEAARILVDWNRMDEEIRAVLDTAMAADDRWARLVCAVALLEHDPKHAKAIACIRKSLRPARRDGWLVVEALHRLRDLGAAARPFLAEVETASRQGPEEAGLAARAHWAITGERHSSLVMARHALEYGYFSDCAMVVRLRRQLEPATPR